MEVANYNINEQGGWSSLSSFNYATKWGGSLIGWKFWKLGFELC